MLLVTLAANLGVAVVEGGYGLVSGSLGMQADALHALLHGLGSGIGIVGVWLAGRPPDRSHPYGYERYEPLAALGTIAVMVLAIREILANVVARVGTGVTPSVTALSFAAVAVAVLTALALAVWERRRGADLGSTVLLADSRRLFADALASLTVVIGLLAALAGVPLLDAVVAIGIAGLIAWTGWAMLRELSSVLTDAVAADVSRIERAARDVPGVLGVHRVRARGVAGAVRVDLHVTVDPLMPVVEAHELTHRVREVVRGEVGGIAEVLVHVGVDPELEHPDEE